LHSVLTAVAVVKDGKSTEWIY